MKEQLQGQEEIRGVISELKLFLDCRGKGGLLVKTLLAV
jgi:hypothetical protein